MPSAFSPTNKARTAGKYLPAIECLWCNDVCGNARELINHIKAPGHLANTGRLGNDSDRTAQAKLYEVAYDAGIAIFKLNKGLVQTEIGATGTGREGGWVGQIRQKKYLVSIDGFQNFFKKTL